MWHSRKKQTEQEVKRWPVFGWLSNKLWSASFVVRIRPNLDHASFAIILILTNREHFRKYVLRHIWPMSDVTVVTWLVTPLIIQTKANSVAWKGTKTDKCSNDWLYFIFFGPNQQKLQLQMWKHLKTTHFIDSHLKLLSKVREWSQAEIKLSNLSFLSLFSFNASVSCSHAHLTLLLLMFKTTWVVVQHYFALFLCLKSF